MVSIFILSFITTFYVTRAVIKAAKEKGYVGIDLNKKNVKVPELGGIGIASGIIISLLFLVAVNSFATLKLIFNGDLNVIYILATLCVVLMTIFVGLVDDIFSLRHRYKFVLPFIIALPLMAVKVSSLHKFFIFGMEISPFIYELILIPIGICAATNLTNTFAGFNGLEAGTGFVISFFLFLVGVMGGNNYVIFLSVLLGSSLLAFLFFNWYPSKIFPDDVGNLLIGAMVGSIVILGGVELKGVILLAPHIIDFVFFKIPNGLPSRGWNGILIGEKLYCKGKPVHFAQFVMKIFGGIEEKKLVLFFVFMEVICGIIALII
ncbi:MAG: hypothetical protein QXS37_02280 [Candidatus Aenigmatarchaeota archaeon]